MAHATPHPLSAVLPALARGFRFSWITVGIILLINTGIATFESVEDMRPYWHPFAPWASPRPILRLAIAVAIGAILGHALMVPIKNFILEYLLAQPRLYTLDYVLSHKKTFFFSSNTRILSAAPTYSANCTRVR